MSPTNDDKQVIAVLTELQRQGRDLNGTPQEYVVYAMNSLAAAIMTSNRWYAAEAIVRLVWHAALLYARFKR